MTLLKFSDKKFNSMYKSRLKSSLFFPLIGTIIMFAITVISPVSEMITLSNPDRYEYIHDSAFMNIENIRYILFGYIGPVEETFPDTTILMYMTVIIAAILCAIMTFRDLTGKKTANVYYSLGLSRTKLFTSTYLSGATAVIFMTVVPLATSFIINSLVFGISKELLCAAVFSVSALCNVSLIAYTLSAIAMILSGMFFEGAFFAFFLNSISAIFTFCICMFSEGLLTGGGFAHRSLYDEIFIDSFISTFLGKTSFLNSLAHSATEVGKLSYCLYTGSNDEMWFFTSLETWQSPDFIPVIVWTVILIGLAFLATYLFNNKKAENIGFFATSKPLYRIFFATMIAAFSSLGVTRCRDFTKGLTWLFILISLVVSLLVCLIVNLILSKLSKIRLKEEARFFPVYSAIVILFATIFSTGFFGYTNKIPDLEKVKYVRISAFADDYYGYYGNELCDVDSQFSIPIYLNNFSGENFYLIDTKEDIDDIRELHKDLIKADNAKISSDYTQTKIGSVITLEYTLTNGKTVLRTYRNITPQIIEKMLSCNGVEENIKNSIVSNLDNIIQKINAPDVEEDDYSFGKYLTVFSNDFTSAHNIELTAQQINDLLEAYRKDVEQLPILTLYQPKEKSLGLLTIRNDYEIINNYNDANGEPIIDGLASELSYATLPYKLMHLDGEMSIHISQEMVNTIQWAKSVGIYKYFEIDKTVSITTVEATHNNSSFIKLSISKWRNFNMLFNGISYDDAYVESYCYEKSVDVTLPGSHIVYNLTESEINYIRENAYPIYLATTPGYFIKMTTDTSNHICMNLFIPDSVLTDELKTKLAEGIIE
ncbi:MAG: hypothetical protein E7536_04970 [Ruminococcaceae bacterium]|nr:hypothetical protein [Oscillospiraceae bacterium]